MDGPFVDWPHGTDGADNAKTSTTITELKAARPTRCRCGRRTGRMIQAEEWSDPNATRAGTGKGNREAVFRRRLSDVVTLSVFENTSSGQPVGTAVEAGDEDGNRLTYSLKGPGADSFTINSSGQIRTRSPLDYESREFYSVTVKVDDGQRKDNSTAAKSVTIRVRDIVETPLRARAPRVTGIPGSTDQRWRHVGRA